jgi:hypothetical protein
VDRLQHSISVSTAAQLRRLNLKPNHVPGQNNGSMAAVVVEKSKDRLNESTHKLETASTKTQDTSDDADAD